MKKTHEELLAEQKQLRRELAKMKKRLEKTERIAELQKELMAAMDRDEPKPDKDST